MKQELRDEGRGELTRDQVRDRYRSIARTGGCCTSGGAGAGCCGEGGASPCCGDPGVASSLGYSAEQLTVLPDGANLGLGCGNPTALLALRPGQVVLDLGSGAGVDCFLAARKVGRSGRVVGVDMTPEMVTKARENARQGKFPNVEFRLGEIEHLPVADRSVDVVISNCVINLAPDKAPVYREAFRVLRPGGRLAVSDVVATKPISKRDREDPRLWSSCSSGAISVTEVNSLLRKAGFAEVRVDLKVNGIAPANLGGPASLGVYSADIHAVRPR